MAKKTLTLIAALALSGCVSTGKYKDLETLFNAEAKKSAELETRLGKETASNQDLSKSKSELEDEKAKLIGAKSQLESQTSDLAAQKAKLEADMVQLTSQKNALEGEKQALLAAAAERQRQADAIVNQLQQQVSDGNLKIRQYQNMLTVDVADKILFDSGKVEIKPAGKKVLEAVGAALANSDKTIRVVGHTDNVPVTAGTTYASNWELSAARATGVVRFLQETAKLDPKRLIAEGRGEHAPVAPNDSPENRQKNRRIEITLLDKSLVEAVEVKK